MLNILQLLSLMASANITSTKPDVVSLIPLHNMLHLLHVTICLILRVSVMLRQGFYDHTFVSNVFVACVFSPI